MSWLKRRGRIGHRLNRFNPPRILLLSYWLPHDMSRWLPVADCLPLCVSSPSSCLLAVSSFASLIRSAHPFRSSPRRACRASVLLSACSSHPLILPALVPLRPLASPCLPAPPLMSAGGGVIISLPSRHASRLPPLRFACPLLGVLTVILNAVAMGTVGCGAFVPRSRKLHLLSIGVVRISSSARRPFFYFLASPFLVSIIVEMAGDLVDEDFFSCAIFARSGAFLGVRVL